MDKIGISNNGSIIHLTNVHGVAKLIALTGNKAVRLAHLYQHRRDLEFAKESASFIEETGLRSSSKDKIFWNCAIIFYIKCFTGNSKRTQLSSNKIYKGNKLALEAFEFFYGIRNKSLIHDENPFSKAIPSAILSQPGSLPKIKGTTMFSVTGSMLEPGNISNLNLLINDALRWISEESKSINSDIIESLEKLEYSDLISIPEPEGFVVPDLDSINKRRDGDF